MEKYYDMFESTEVRDGSGRKELTCDTREEYWFETQGKETSWDDLSTCVVRL